MIDDFYKELNTRLRGLYEKRERKNLFYLLAKYILGFNASELLLYKIENKFIEPNLYRELKQALRSLEKGVPIQYIFSKASFFDFDLYVDKRVFIPRSETQELVEWVIEDHKQQSSLKVIDIGTGSGAIAIALSYYLKTPRVYAIDCCLEALEVAKKNASSYLLDISFHHVDILKDTLEEVGDFFDIIISNPPYIKENEKRIMHTNVIDYEPHLALFVLNDDPLIFYRIILKWAKKRLSPKGTLYFEINQYLYKEVLALHKEMGYSQVELKKDIHGCPRMTKARL